METQGGTALLVAAGRREHERDASLARELKDERVAFGQTLGVHPGHAANVVVLMAVHAGEILDKVRTQPFHEGRQALEGEQVAISIGDDVVLEPLASLRGHAKGPPGDIEHAEADIVADEVQRTVALVRVEVHDQDAGHGAFLKKAPAGSHDVIESAKTGAPPSSGMVCA
jgi:hypothetical protein